METKTANENQSGDRRYVPGDSIPDHVVKQWLEEAENCHPRGKNYSITIIATNPDTGEPLSSEEVPLELEDAARSLLMSFKRVKLLALDPTRQPKTDQAQGAEEKTS